MTAKSVVIATMLSMLFATPSLADQARKPLTNDDVITMVHKKLPESVIISAIQSEPSKFNLSSSELIRLNSSGVTEKELNAMIAASGKGGPAPSSTASPAQVSAELSPSKSRMPRVAVSAGGSIQELKLEKTQLAETKTKPSSMKSLAADAAVTQGLQAGVNTVAYSAMSHMNSPVGGSVISQAGGIFGGVMAHRQPKVTYVWGVPGPASSNVLKSGTPAFTVDFAKAMGVNPDDYAPAIVKLTPAQGTCRIVGATQGKEDARSSAAADWQVYSHFLEERVNVRLEKMAAGKYKISPASELAPGEYGVVLRPTSKEKNFSGGDVARGQGDGLMFDAVWTFAVSEESQ
jgi:methionine-rich copper-binding protein CopC